MNREWEVRVHEDRGGERGNAILVVQGLDMPASGCQFALHRRSGEAVEKLGPEGWSAADHWFTPEVERSTTDVRLRLGPDIVQYMADGNYSLRLRIPGMAELERIIGWRGIAPPLAKAGGGRGRLAEHRETQPQTSAIPNREASQDPAVETQQSGALDLRQDRQEGNGQGQTVGVLPPRHPRWLLASLLGTLGLGVAVGGWWWLVRPPEPPSQDGAEGKTWTEEDARQILQRQPLPTVEELLAFAEKFRGDPRGLQGAAMLYQYAAEGGNARAALMLGKFLDPSDPAASPLQRRADTARKWYRAALAGGESEAQARLQGLRSWVEREAAAGDRAAEQLLTDWE